MTSPHLCPYCKKQITYGHYRELCNECREHHTENETKLCKLCQEIKKWDQFHKNKTLLFDIQSVCKACEGNYHANRMKVKENFLRKMLSRCETTTKRHLDRGRILEFSWTYEQMIAKLAAQNNKCAYSGLPLSFTPHSDWQCTPERINDDIGYIDSNIVFICMEFQLGTGLKSSVEIVDLLATIELEQHPRIEEIMTGIFEEKPFSRHCSLGERKCKECNSINGKNYRNTAEGRMVIMCINAKNATKTRNLRGRDHQFNIDCAYLLKLLQQQEGKCEWSGHHLSFVGGKFNCLSIERMDVNLGYIKGNCALIMRCLNTSDRTSQKSILAKTGCGGWSKKKIDYLRESRKAVV